MLELGPRKMKGKLWDEGGKSKVVKILISHEEDVSKSIQFAYVEKQNVRHSEIYGNHSGLNFDIVFNYWKIKMHVTFNYPSEFLVSVSGEYNYEGLVSISFGSNKRKYGPFRCPCSNDKTYAVDKFKYNFGPKSSFGGFHGSVNKSSVQAIGVYVRPIVSLAEIDNDINRDIGDEIYDY
ncbi:jacalin-like lectin domain-containing protein [Tanacetum coccineum]